MNEIKIKEELQPICNESLQLKVKSKGDLLVATDLRARLKDIYEKIDAEKQKVLRPLNDARMAEIARWKPVLGYYQDAIDHVTSEMTNYQTKQKKLEEARREKILDSDLDQDTMVDKLSKMKEVDKRVGNTTFIETKCFEVMEPAMIFATIVTDYHGDSKVMAIDYDALNKFMIPNEVAIRKAMLEGTELPGVRYYTEQRPRNNR